MSSGDKSYQANLKEPSITPSDRERVELVGSDWAEPSISVSVWREEREHERRQHEREAQHRREEETKARENERREAAKKAEYERQELARKSEHERRASDVLGSRRFYVVLFLLVGLGVLAWVGISLYRDPTAPAEAKSLITTFFGGVFAVTIQSIVALMTQK